MAADRLHKEDNSLLLKKSGEVKAPLQNPAADLSLTRAYPPAGKVYWRGGWFLGRR